MLRPKPHNTACTGLALSASTTGWALRVAMNSRAEPPPETSAAVSFFTAWNNR